MVGFLDEDMSAAVATVDQYLVPVIEKRPA